jgi:acetylornithine deacetylase/succinyl-diaminopimelate desuccinylase-like protein
VARTVLHRPALETNRDETVVRALASAIETTCAAEPEVTGMSYWADSAFISSLGVPTVLFGPSGEGAHADEEWVSLIDTIACTRVLVATAEAMSRR